jgi:hypothetical protein
MAGIKEASLFSVGHILQTGAEGFGSGAVFPWEFIVRAPYRTPRERALMIHLMRYAEYNLT